jgi:hypothetical protein
MIKRKAKSQTVDSRPQKVGNQSNFLVCRWHAIYRSKALNEGYNFASDLVTIGGLHAKLCAPKVAKVPIVGILGLPLESLETKNHLHVALMKRHKIYYKGEGGDFLQVQAMVSMICS